MLLLEGCCKHSFISVFQYWHMRLLILLTEESEVFAEGTRLLQTTCKPVITIAPGTAFFWVQRINRALTRRTLITHYHCCSPKRNSSWQNTIIKRKVFGMNQCVCDIYKRHLHPVYEGSTILVACSWLPRSSEHHQAHPQMMVQWLWSPLTECWQGD